MSSAIRDDIRVVKIAPFVKRILCILAVFVVFPSYGQDISFYRENITMRISVDKFYVTGLYYLRCDKPEKKLLAYPFPLDKLYGQVDSILIYDLTSDTGLSPLRSDSAGLVFAVDFRSGGEKLVQISYQQELLGNRAEYILKSTRAWRQPLDEAHYQLVVTNDFIMTHFSIPPQDSIMAGKEKVYTWDMMNYMPLENMVFGFNPMENQK